MKTWVFDRSLRKPVLWMILSRSRWKASRAPPRMIPVCSS
jgi:hypothetical protein